MNAYQWSSVFIIAGVTLVAAVLDVRTRRIPNWFTVPVFAAGLLFHTLTGGWSGLGTALAGFGTGFGILLVLWLIGGGGGGDVKLMGAVGAWLGATYTLFVVLLSAGFAAVFSVAVILTGVTRHGYSFIRRKYLRRPDQMPARRKKDPTMDEATQRKTGRRILPYALPVACSTWLILFWHVLSKTP